MEWKSAPTKNFFQRVERQDAETGEKSAVKVEPQDVEHKRRRDPPSLAPLIHFKKVQENRDEEKREELRAENGETRDPQKRRQHGSAKEQRPRCAAPAAEPQTESEDRNNENEFQHEQRCRAEC